MSEQVMEMEAPNTEKVIRTKSEQTKAKTPKNKQEKKAKPPVVENKIETTPEPAQTPENKGVTAAVETAPLIKRGRGRPPLSEEEKEKRQKERERLRYQGLTPGKGNAVIIEFPVEEEVLGNMVFHPSDQRRKDVYVYHAYPRLCDYNAALISDRGVNPREHPRSLLSSPIAKACRQTLTENPENFEFHSRGVTILAANVDWRAKKKIIISLDDWDSHGIADGATTNLVIMEEQQDFLGDRKFEEVPIEEWPEYLQLARVHLEILVGMEDRETIAEFVEARNTSRQVKKFSISNFRGHFDWLKSVIENSKFQGKIGETENTEKPVDILDVVSLITLFHPGLDDIESFNPAVAYASRSRLDGMFVDEKLDAGYKNLAPIVPDILDLRDELYVGFADAYEKSNADGRLARRKGFEAKSHILPLSGREANYKIPNAFIMVLLSAFRALVDQKNGAACWKTPPTEFWQKHGHKLMRELIRQAKAVGNNQNMLGKSEIAYSALYREAMLLSQTSEKPTIKTT